MRLNSEDSSGNVLIWIEVYSYIFGGSIMVEVDSRDSVTGRSM